MANEVRVNGNVLSWGSTILRINGISQNWITSLSYSEKRERSQVYGMGRHQGPRGRTRGKYSVEAPKMKGPKADVQGFIDYLAGLSANGASYGDVEFNVMLQYVEAFATVTVELEGCVVAGVTASEDEGAEALQDELELNCLRIRRNGKTLWDSSVGG